MILGRKLPYKALIAVNSVLGTLSGVATGAALTMQFALCALINLLE